MNAVTDIRLPFRKQRPDNGEIVIQGAREHNLKNLNLAIPRNQFVVVTGVSGSGKSTLAFDLIFAEGQRRFLDSMNVYARQFVDQMARPDVDLVTGIPPTVSIEQRSSRGGGKSTVATVTEVYHFIRLLYARLGTQFCPNCQVPVEAQTKDELERGLRAQAKSRGELVILAPVVKHRKGFHTDVAEWATRHGFAELRADGVIRPSDEKLRLDRFREHDVEIVVGRLDGKARSGAAPLIEQALKMGDGVLLAMDGEGKITTHSTERACPECGLSFAPLDPKNFSYNSPQGWCPKCRGFGELFYLPDVDRGARAEAIEESWFEWQEGSREICPDCLGSRLAPLARAVRLYVGGNASPRLPLPFGPLGERSLPGGRGVPCNPAPTIEQLSNLSVEEAAAFFHKARFGGRAGLIARDILPEIRDRLKFMREVGLGYLQLGRGVPTLSGGESQRIRLAAQLGSNLSGVLYVLDEPTIGLHPRDNQQLLAALEKLRHRGNSVLVVEHDEDTMRRADYIIDLGPGAGTHGGKVIAAGTLQELLRHEDSVTGKCLRAHKSYPTRGQRRPVDLAGEALLTLRGARLNNLKDVTMRVPLGRLVLVTGVSGSGKSTLVRECLLPAICEAIEGRKRRGSGKAAGEALTGADSIQSVYEVDQSPIGRTPRSIPATYVGFFDDIRALFAQVPEARLRGYGPGRFSFNSPQGRCPGCEGAGTVKLEMNFLPPAFVRCEQCGGCRFNRETLDIEYSGRNVAQVLDMSVEEASDFFSSHRKIKRALAALCDTGLGYLHLGQTSPTLSGGEAQRVKLVTHLLSGLREPDLFDRLERRNFFILEEPTIGLHMADVKQLAGVLQRLVDAGHTVLVIEHNLELVAEADWVIDLGPEGGEGGGRIIGEGTPEAIARNKRSHTGRFLRSVLE